MAQATAGYTCLGVVVCLAFFFFVKYQFTLAPVLFSAQEITELAT